MTTKDLFLLIKNVPVNCIRHYVIRVKDNIVNTNLPCNTSLTPSFSTKPGNVRVELPRPDWLIRKQIIQTTVSIGHRRRQSQKWRGFQRYMVRLTSVCSLSRTLLSVQVTALLRYDLLG